MKIIKYKFLSAEINNGTEESPIMEQIIYGKAIPWSETNEEIAKREAYNGEYTIEEVEEEPAEATLEERTAALEEALTLLLEGATE